MTDKRKQELIDEMLFSLDRRENDFPIINKDGKFLEPITRPSGVHAGYARRDGNPKYRGIVLEVNDHGNITVWRQFKNGNRREIASRV